MSQRSNLLYGIILILPIIDIATAFTEKWPISVDAINLALIMMILFLYLMMLLRNRLIRFLLVYSIIMISFIEHFFTITSFSLLAVISFYLKIAYFTT